MLQDFESVSDHFTTLRSKELMATFQNSPNKLHSNSGSEKIMSPRFYAVSFVSK